MTLLFLVARQQPEPVKWDEAAASIPDLTGYPWFYLRDGRSLTDTEMATAVTLLAVGDVMLGRGVAEVAEPLAAVAPWLSAADLTFGNLESVIVTSGTPRTAPAGAPQPIILNAPVTAVAHLTTAGFDLLSLANNHSLDYGGEGVAETAVRLQQAGITPLGIGMDVEAAYAPVFQEVKGVRLAFLALNAVFQPGDGASSLDGAASNWVRADWQSERVVQAVTAARQQADAVIVSVHWGYEHEQRVDPWQETAVQTLLAAGADVIIGHHPHVAQPVIVDRQAGKLAAYSLGNFVFDQTQEGLVLRVFVDGEGLRAVQVLPIGTGLHPRLMTPIEAESLLARVQPAVPRLAFACTLDTCNPVEVLVATEDTGWFWSGAIDLTGDGVPEQVRRTGEQVTVYEGATAVWQSPPTWRVVDVALGDPNDDGRFELLLAIWQTDSEGYERSQPYIVGYRQGEYQLLWGGRPVNTPILAVELGDVDGDGAGELVVLEQQAEGQSVAVWRWQGWSFSLMWRSESGRFQNLSLLPDTKNQFLITVSP
jgi:poly-gamma-glutamate synthesis protein (capsule biosynthesis protein)